LFAFLAGVIFRGWLGRKELKMHRYAQKTLGTADIVRDAMLQQQSF
jgi:hypothetical protein